MSNITRRLKSIAKRWLNRVRRAATVFMPYRPMSGGEERLDRQYSKGSWNYLRGVSELPRFSLAIGYCHHLRPNGRIAEVGAGDGIFHERLDRTKYATYLGVDISKIAIDRLLPRRDADNDFVSADAATYSPPGQYDLIVFTEVLEYFDRPDDVVCHWSNFLAPDGLIIVSMFSGLDTARSIKIWRMLNWGFRTVALSDVRNEQGLAWKVKVLEPRTRAQSDAT